MTTPRDPGLTPKGGEMSWGENLMPNPDDEPVTPYHQLKAASQTNRNSDNEGYVEEVVKGWFPGAAT